MKLVKLLILFCIPFLTFAKDKKEEKSKIIRKTFNVSENNTVYINNRYGNINVTTWDKNIVDFEVKITVSGKNIEQVNDKLESISVDFQQSKNKIQAITAIGKQKKQSGWLSWFTGNHSNLNFKIQYNVKLPRTNQIDFINKYGNIDITEVLGSSKIKCQYGNIYVEALRNKSNTIILDYSSSSSINYINSGIIDADYSKIKVEKAETLKIDADYTNLDFEKVDVVKFDADYGNIHVDKTKSIICRSDYTDIRLGSVLNNMFINTDYGNVRIQNFKGNESSSLSKYADFISDNTFNIAGNKSIINGDYASIRIGTLESNNFGVEVSTSYGGFKYPKKLMNFSIEKEKVGSSYYKGRFGKSENNINTYLKIDSDYGSVSIKINN